MFGAGLIPAATREVTDKKPSALWGLLASDRVLPVAPGK